MLLSLVTIVPSGSGSGQGGAQIAAAGDAGGPGAQDAGTGPATNGATSQAAGSGATQAAAGAAAGGQASGIAKSTPVSLSCAAGSNGGNTDVGVSASSIKLAATVVADGPGSSFLGPVRTGITTVLDKINNSGGVCGRRLDLTLRNDSWDAARGKQYIQNFVEGDKVFALAVVPSSEGLREADAYIQQQKVPVVGTDGMLIHQYKNPWIWPVATSTISTMHAMAKNAADRGSKRFGIVFDAQYHFGVEGAFAFNQAVKRLTGDNIPGFDSQLKSCTGRFCGIQPGKPSYSGDAKQFNDACFSGAGTCDFIAYLLEPDTALSFLREGRPANPQIGFAGAQPLFTRPFAENCQRPCDGMWVWTGYNPPLESLASDPDVARYVNEVHQESASADTTNQFLEGGYIGMSLMVQALQKVGPALTRQNLKNVLDSMTFSSGLTSPLAWRPGNHFANVSAQAFEIQYKQSFNGWRKATSFIADPWVGEDIPSGE
ncbi:MAG TPA: ABC transporter substrate-binding protein [Acidimicrobiales bacterium]|nr:ABC transporter substrate-binding protein [Acidimicrobiales bacterium]